jgi:xylulokinase
MKNARRLLVGIDLGTTGTRCMIFDTNGRCVSSVYAEYPLIHPQSGWVEQSVPLMLQTTARVCREAAGRPGVRASDIASVGVSTQMCATCPTDSSGELLREMISWQDTRAGAEVDVIASAVSQQGFKAITGGPIIVQLTIAKMLWLRTHEPQTFARATKWLQLQTLLLRFLGAEGFFVDIPEAFYYGLWDVAKSQWSPKLLALAGVSADRFGEAVAAGTQVGTLSETAAALTGFPVYTPLCVGGGDSVCGLVGMGAVATGSASITLGTAGVLTMGIATPRVDLAEFFTMNHPVPGQWMVQAPTLAAASAYRWFRDVFGQVEIEAAARDGGSAFDHLNSLAADVSAGADGLLFLPYLNSAGAPHFNTQARGAFIGVTQNHSRGHFVRAILEGVALEMRDVLERLAAYDLAPSKIRIGGGATKSPLWNQIQADVYGMPVDVLDQGESTALGAAILGGVGAGIFDALDEGIDAMVHVAHTLEPGAANRRRYTDVYLAYSDAYHALAASTFGRISEMQRSPP